MTLRYISILPGLNFICQISTFSTLQFDLVLPRVARFTRAQKIRTKRSFLKAMYTFRLTFLREMFLKIYEISCFKEILAQTNKKCRVLDRIARLQCYWGRPKAIKNTALWTAARQPPLLIQPHWKEAFKAKVRALEFIPRKCLNIFCKTFGFNRVLK